MLNNVRKLNVTENSSNFIQIAPENPGNMSHPTGNTQKEMLTQITKAGLK